VCRHKHNNGGLGNDDRGMEVLAPTMIEVLELVVEVEVLPGKKDEGTGASGKLAELALDNGAEANGIGGGDRGIAWQS